MSKRYREKLQVSLRGDFSSFARERGERLFKANAVHFNSGHQWQVLAKVVDGGTHSIRITRSGDTLDLDCSCPTAQARFLCPHFWAVILGCDQRSYLLGRFDSGNAHLQPGWKRTSEPESVPEDDLEADFDVDRRPADALRQLRPSAGHRKQRPSPPDQQPWLQQLAPLKAFAPYRPPAVTETWPSSREVYYLLDLDDTRETTDLTVTVAYRDLKQNGEWGKLKYQRLARSLLTRIPNQADRELLLMLGGAPDPLDGYNSIPSTYRLRFGLHEELFRRMSATGRFRLRPAFDATFEQLAPLTWDDGAPWRFELVVREEGDQWLLTGRYRREDQILDLSDVILVHEIGVLATVNMVARFEHEGSIRWISLLARGGGIRAPKEQGRNLVREVMALPVLPRTHWPDQLRFQETGDPPRTVLKISERRTYYRDTPKLEARLMFDYGGTEVDPEDPRSGIYQPELNRYLRRHAGAEQAAAEILRGLKLKPSPYHYGEGRPWEIPNKRLPAIARELASRGWHIEAQGKAFRNASSVNVSLTSGIDWFELHGEVDFGAVKVKLPDLLKALRKGEEMIALPDGSIGFLPQDILEQYGMLFGLGKAHEDHVRFSKSQTGLLDVLLAQRPEIPVDQTFRQAREALRRFEGIAPAPQPEGLTGGELRLYQREGVAWMAFLREFGWGGCLADDMGVGKTAQVLALLETRRAEREAFPERKIPPSLVVVPRSLVYNWKQEAAKFTPRLRVLDHTGIERDRTGAAFDGCDVVLTTYGTLRRDVIDFGAFRFDYVILDEAQAIKNASSESAKAARLLNANHRLALSGTPIENHLGELWSIFEFLNPGMLGGAHVFQGAGAALRNPDEATRSLLSRALRPFILRRTKSQVAPELPDKIEETIYCEMDSTQRKLYNELRDHYRMSLLGRVDREGIARSKMHILEALLRLRQAACHPGLIDRKRSAESSAKIETLFARLEEVVEENHKSLVFSQFTSLLAIVRSHLDRQGISYAYLDGQTGDRQAAVERFQTEEDCKLFLISLKAGGVGLNLTAAEYVFLLDPWWNPAVESQAIDRAHRIGQRNSVFAYRLIAKDTVEEKVLQLQETKRSLADAIINADNRLIGSLGREDLELLLS